MLAWSERKNKKTLFDVCFCDNHNCGRAERERERGVRGRDVEGAGQRGIRRRGGAERGLNGGRNGPSPNSSPSHTHSTNHCWGSTAPSNNSSGFHKVKFLRNKFSKSKEMHVVI